MEGQKIGFEYVTSKGRTDLDLGRLLVQNTVKILLPPMHTIPSMSVDIPLVNGQVFP